MAKIRLVLMVPDTTRRALRVEAAKADLDMGELAAVALDYVMGLMDQGKTPPQVAAAIKKLQPPPADDE